MTNSSLESLSLLGWDDFFESQKTPIVSEKFFPARVVCEERGLYRIQFALESSILAVISGKMQFAAEGRADFPSVGDWVLVLCPPGSDRALIQHVFSRKTVIQRRQIGGQDMQILSANVDWVFITTSVNEDLNFRRLDRYLTVARESGAVPVILLTKADTCAHRILEITSKVEREFPDVAVHALAQESFAECTFFADYLCRGKTAVVVGSSGVGKSTLVNFLIGEEKIRTQEIREADAKGRHTTTSRSLYVSVFGGLIIDTPGMRELQLADHGEGVRQQFADIEELEADCRFRDCAHETEPSCSVQNALSLGTLDVSRWKSYKKLNAELLFELRKQARKVRRTLSGD